MFPACRKAVEDCGERRPCRKIQAGAPIRARRGASLSGRRHRASARAARLESARTVEPGRSTTSNGTNSAISRQCRHRMAYNLFDLDNTHENAFYFDERNQVIYVSFRDINRIVKIQYPSGKVLNTYGALYTPGGPAYLVNGLFCGQHNCRLSQDGYLYMFNNNLCNPKSNPTILMLREPVTEKDSLQKVWEYVCPMDEVHENKQAGILFNSGGSVAELADSSFFVCMGSAYGKVFIVNRDKALLWCAQPEKWDITNGKWANQIEYRASIVARKDLESMIWNEPLKN